LGVKGPRMGGIAAQGGGRMHQHLRREGQG
jgi:hypothetical protein